MIVKKYVIRKEVKSTNEEETRKKIMIFYLKNKTGQSYVNNEAERRENTEREATEVNSMATEKRSLAVVWKNL